MASLSTNISMHLPILNLPPDNYTVRNVLHNIPLFQYHHSRNQCWSHCWRSGCCSHHSLPPFHWYSNMRLYLSWGGYWSSQQGEQSTEDNSCCHNCCTSSTCCDSGHQNHYPHRQDCTSTPPWCYLPFSCLPSSARRCKPCSTLPSS